MTRNLSILLVEDNRADAAMVVRLLKESELPHTLTIIADGAAVAEHLAHGPLPDLILLDLNLPHKSGHQVLIETKGDPRLRAIPVVILTTSSAADDVVRSYGGQAASYIVKPTNLVLARAAIRSLSSYWGDTVTLPFKEDLLWEYWE